MNDDKDHSLTRKKYVAIILLYFFSFASYAGNLCHGSFVNPITDVCWSCLFPITIGNVAVISSSVPDNSSNPSVPLCYCNTPVPRVGISIGFWEPMALVDVTRLPFCLVNLGGLQLSLGLSVGTGTQETANSNQNNSFYHVHWYRFPLLFWLKILTDELCLETGDLDIAYLTELDPTWRNDEWGFVLNPEAILFGNPIAQAACAADALSASTIGPIDYLFWCAGAQGSLYPLTGHVQEHVGGVQASTLLTERMVFKLHRKGLLWESAGENGPALCQLYTSAFMPKSRYRYQMVNPIPTTRSGGCHPFGATTMTWGAGHEYPFNGEDFGYLVWRKRNCCL